MSHITCPRSTSGCAVQLPGICTNRPSTNPRNTPQCLEFPRRPRTDCTTVWGIPPPTFSLLSAPRSGSRWPGRVRQQPLQRLRREFSAEGCVQPAFRNNPLDSTFRRPFASGIIISRMADRPEYIALRGILSRPGARTPRSVGHSGRRASNTRGALTCNPAFFPCTTLCHRPVGICCASPCKIMPGLMFAHAPRSSRRKFTNSGQIRPSSDHVRLRPQISRGWSTVGAIQPRWV